MTSVLPEQVQNIAVRTCGFLPAAETAAQLIAAFGGPAVPDTAYAIAREICAAVTRRSVSRGRPATPRVHGVVIRGQFVR